MSFPDDRRLLHQEAALLALLERVALLERALSFEVRQRERMEEVILKLTGLPRRVDRLECVCAARGQQ